MCSLFIAELETSLPSDCVLLDEASRAAFAGDKWTRGPLPDVVVRPRNVTEVATLMRLASQHNIAVTTRGAGWGYVGGAATNRGGVLLSLDRMNAIREISDSDFVAVVEAGVVTADLQRAAQLHGLFYPPDPASAAHCTLGGNIATNAGGPRCLKYGVTRNYVLGLEVVTAQGTVLNLGSRTHKNATGFDMVGLFVGSEGMLGIVTSATLKLLPLPTARAGLSAVFSDIKAASLAVGAIFAAGILPAACEVADEYTYRQFQIMKGQLPSGGAHLLLEVDGTEAATREEAAQLALILKERGAIHIEVAQNAAEVENLWETRRQFSAGLTALGRIKLNEDVVVPRGRLVDLVEFARELGVHHGLEVACFGHAGDGNIHVNLLVEKVDANTEAALDELFAQILAWGGAITGEHGIGLAKAKWWPDAVSNEVITLHKQLKTTVDPQGILNPAKWL
jgi:glycolate oxidase